MMKFVSHSHALRSLYLAWHFRDKLEQGPLQLYGGGHGNSLFAPVGAVLLANRDPRDIVD